MDKNKSKESVKQTKGQLTYIRILESAVREVALKGFEGLVLTDVASLAGTTRGALLQHFKNRENLIDEASIYLGNQGRDFTFGFMKGNTTQKDRILLYIEATFAWARERREQAIFLTYLLNRAGYDKSSSYHAKVIFQGARSRLAMDIFEVASEKKKSHMTTQIAEEMALQIHTNLLGYIVLVATNLDRDIITFEKQCLQVTKLILNSQFKD
jgi:AcrR family transcriptional regulator